MKHKVSKKYSKPKTNADGGEDFFFDDCIICQGMKKAQKEGKSLNETELRDLFEKQNMKNRQN